MAGNTRERIMEAALEIFARDGYSGTNIKDIAASVGIVKSALYRHFESKEDIWNSINEMMSKYYDEHFGSADKPIVIPDSTNELYEMTMRMVDFTIHDKRVIEMRKIIQTEQFRDEKIKKMASNYFVYDVKGIFEKVFSEMMKKKLLIKENPDILAFSYTAPISSMIHLCDREPEKENEAMKRIKDFVLLFIKTYGVK